MKRVLITGSEGFIGKNLMARLKRLPDLCPVGFDLADDITALEKELKVTDFIVHLAGVNRPKNNDDFTKGNSDFTYFITDALLKNDRLIPLILSSSTQASFDNPYGRSKLSAEKIISEYNNRGGAGYIYRLTNVFGKWCRPDYNSVVATFCHNIANGKEIFISDPEHNIELVHVDDVVNEFINVILENKYPDKNIIQSVSPVYKVSLGYLSDLISTFKKNANSCLIPDLNDPFIKKLHSTFLSYVPLDDANYFLEKKSDERGYVFELIKSVSMGQIFISRTKEGITRGNHFHHLKNEKFCVVDGQAEIKFRHIITNETHRFIVDGNKPEVVNILPGYTHSITNIGENELITLFWANEPFDPNNPDTYFEVV